MSYPIFDRNRLRLRPLGQRQHDLGLSAFLNLDDPLVPFQSKDLDSVAERVAAAQRGGSHVILMMGGHLIRSGVSRYIIDLMESGVITHLGMNGACVIHDFELSLVGATTESVARYIQTGEFGLWQETGRINDAARQGAKEGIGLGEAVGRMIADESHPYQDISVLAAAYRLRIPATVHVGIGYDIVHQHPNCDGGALGATSYHDFLVFAETVYRLQGGVFLNFGTAVMGPEVYLKALAMARNVAHQEGRRINAFTTAVFDLQDLGPDTHAEPPKSAPSYYFRPLKTILVRTVQDGGESFYVRGPHRVTFPNLHHRILGQLGGSDG